MSDGAESDAWSERPFGYTPTTVIMCLGESSCDESYRGDDGIRYYCRRTPGHPAVLGHDCPADRDARDALRAVRSTGVVSNDEEGTQ